MQAYLSNLSRFCLSDFDLVYKDATYDKFGRLALLQDHPDVAAYLTTVINTRHLMMFDEPLINAELVKGLKGPELNMLSEERLSACSLGPIAIEAWEVDLLMNAKPINENTLDIQEPIELFKGFIADQPTLVPTDVLVSAYYASEVHQAAQTLELGTKQNESDLSFNLGTAMLDIIMSRNSIIQDAELGAVHSPSKETTYGPE